MLAKGSANTHFTPWCRQQPVCVAGGRMYIGEWGIFVGYRFLEVPPECPGWTIPKYVLCSEVEN